MTTQNKRLLAPFLLLFLCDILVTLVPIPEIGFIGTIGLLFFLPGWTLLEACFPSPARLVERILLASGLSYAVSVLGALYLIYLVGTISQMQLAGALTLWCLLWQGVALLRREKLRAWQVSRREWLILGLLLGLALSLRLPRLGYSEFHEDEIEVLNFATRILDGENYALFLHRKGPIQTLIPGMVWLNTARITEWIARFPFALASVLGIMVTYVLTIRLAHATDRTPYWSGLVAGLLLAVNGFSVAFSRLVQYQAIILFLGPLAIWTLWYARLKKSYSWLVISALFFAVCTLAHYDSLLYLPVMVYLSGLILKDAYGEQGEIGRALKWFSLSGLLYIVIVLSFYLPYTQDPQFDQTVRYLSDSRIGQELLYNNLSVLQRIDADYNSHFYLLILFLLAISLLVKWSKTPVTKIGLLICIGLVASTYWLPKAWEIEDWPLAFIPWLLWLILGWKYLGQSGAGERVAWIWWLTSFMGYVFFVDKPGAHFYIAYPGWAAVAGMGLGQIWPAGSSKRAYSGRVLIIAAGLAAMLILFYYQTILFWHTDATYRQEFSEAWEAHPLRPIYQAVPKRYEYFGAPRRLGWKAIGALLAGGTLQGDYRSANEIFSVPIWYTYQTPRSCFNDPQNYFVGQPDGDRPEILQAYTPAGNIVVEDAPRIALFVKGPLDQNPVDYHLADYSRQFDRGATLANFTHLARPQYPLRRRFGEAITFLGFSLSKETLQPGETLAVTLQWQAIAPVDIAYRVFVHLEKDQIWGQHDDDPACRLPTTLWRAGQSAQGQFRIVVDPATPAGDYPLTIGLYNPADWQRLPIFDDQNNEIGDSLLLTTINVEAGLR